MAIGRPSSENPIAPASHSSAISVSSSPSIPRVTLATNPTGIEASRSARFRTEPRTAAESIGGEVGHRDHRAIAAGAAERVPVSRSSLCSWPGTRKWTGDRRTPGPRAGRSHRRPRPRRSRERSGLGKLGDLAVADDQVTGGVQPGTGIDNRAPRTISVAAGAGRLVSEGASGAPPDPFTHAHAGCPIVGVSAGAGPRSGLARSLPARSS